MFKIKAYIQLQVRAGALQFTIAFALLVLLIMLSFILFQQLRKKELIYLRVNGDLTLDVKSAMLILEESADLFKQSSFYIHPGGFFDSIQINIKEWGLFHHVEICNQKHQLKQRKCFIYSDDIKKNKLKPSLYFSDPHRYLSIGGNTFLGTETYLPAYGIRATYLNGVGFFRDSLVQGISHTADDELPLLNSAITNKYDSLYNSINSYDSIVHLNSISTDSIANSFKNNRLIIFCPEETILNNISFIGNIMIVGDHIDIRNTTGIENCIVLAKSIRIEDQFHGCGQFIVKESISAGDSCNFLYPTIFHSSSNSIAGKIYVGTGSFFSGEIIYPQLVSEEIEVITLGEKSKIIGQVYCNGIISFEGTLFGSMYCRGFIFRTYNSINNNLLFNVCIDRSRLPLEYGGITLTEESNGKKCILEVF